MTIVNYPAICQKLFINGCQLVYQYQKQTYSHSKIFTKRVVRAHFQIITSYMLKSVAKNPPICKHKQICEDKHKHVGPPSKPAILICRTDEVTPLPVSVSLLPFQSCFLSNLRHIKGGSVKAVVFIGQTHKLKSHWDQHINKTATDESNLRKQAYVIMIDRGLGWQIWMT